MQKRIQSSKILLTIFGIVYTLVAVGLFFFLYMKNKQTWILIPIIAFLIVGIGAFITLSRVVKDGERFDKAFYPVQEGKGPANVQSIAQKLEERLRGTFFIVETNEDGFRVLEGLDEHDEEQMAQGKFGIADGYTYLKTSDPNKFKEIAMELNVWMEDGQVRKEPVYIGGRNVNMSAVVEIERDEEGKIQIQKEADYTAQLTKIIKEAKEQDGWSTSMDEISKYALAMAVLGLGGAILAIIMLFAQKLI